MWIYKIKAEKTKFGFFKIPKNCVNAEWGNFEELLKSDYKKEVKSAVVNWFNDKYNQEFSIGMNGYHSILLITNDNIQEEIDFIDYQIIGDYLVHYDGEKDWIKNRKLVNRSIKIDKILKRNEQKLQKSYL